jgi:hypothetical protein
MHHPPHPGLVFRECLGDRAVTTAASHLRITRVTLSRMPLWCLSNYDGVVFEIAP